MTEPACVMRHADVIQAAETLVNEHQSGARFQPFATAFGMAGVDDAYAVQREYVRLQMQARAVGAAGYKIGLTSQANAGDVRHRQPDCRRRAQGLRASIRR